MLSVSVIMRAHSTEDAIHRIMEAAKESKFEIVESRAYAMDDAYTGEQLDKIADAEVESNHHALIMRLPDEGEHNYRVSIRIKDF